MMRHLELRECNDEEGGFIPDGLPRVIDAHVHIFPSKIFASLWSWFDQHAWDRELKWLSQSPLSHEDLELILHKNVEQFFEIG